MKDKIKILKDQLENLWKEYCLERDKYCQYCGSKDNLQVHHIVSRKNNSVKYDVENGITLCKRCHSRISLNPTARIEFMIWYIKKYSLEKLEYLQMKSKEIKQWKISELEEEIENLKEKIKENEWKGEKR